MFRIAADVKRISGRCAPQNALNRCKSFILIDISYYSALIASVFQQRFFKGTYEEPQNMRYIIFRFGSITKKVLLLSGPFNLNVPRQIYRGNSCGLCSERRIPFLIPRHTSTSCNTSLNNDSKPPKASHYNANYPHQTK